MKKYIAPEISLIKELENDFCEGDNVSIAPDKFGYVQLESVNGGDMEE